MTEAAHLPLNVFDTLKAIGRDDSSTMNTLIGLYKEQAPEMIATIKLSASEKEPSNLKDAAHTFKGVCVNLGLTPLGNICQDIETAALQEDYLRVNALCTQLENTHSEVLSRMSTLNHG